MLESVSSVDFPRSDVVYQRGPVPRGGLNFGCDLLEVLPDGCIVAGSYAASLIGGPGYADLDIFFTANQTLTAFDVLLANGWWEPEDPVTSGCKNLRRSGWPNVQLVVRDIYDDVSHVLDSFDLVCAQVALTRDAMVWHPDAPAQIRDRVIKVHRISHPQRLPRRIAKYIEKGYRYDAEEAAALPAAMLVLAAL